MKVGLWLILMICALICELISAFSAYLNPPPKINFMTLGFAFVIAAFAFA